MPSVIDGLKEVTAIVQKKLDQHPDWTDEQIEAVVREAAAHQHLLTHKEPFSITSAWVAREDGYLVSLHEFIAEVRKSQDNKA